MVSNNICTGQGSCDAWGAGIGCWNCPEPNNIIFTITAESNIISNNHAVADSNWAADGGVLFQHVTGIFRDNIVSNNEIYDNNISYGGAAGLGIMYPQEGTIVSGNTFSSNVSNGWCGALNFETYSGEVNFRIVVENNYFLDNQAERGGAIACANVPLNIQNNVFRGNTASTSGGAVLLIKNMALSFHHMAEVVNNSFYHNTADNGGAIYSYNAKPLVFNSIFWQDSASTGPEIYIPSYIADTVEIANSDIDFNLIYGRINNGGDNINEDPLYDDPDLLTLLTNSPCLDDGIKTFICDCGVAHNCPGYDILGIQRPQSGGVEMGAYELLFEGVKPVTVVSRQSSVVSCYPNPARDIVDFRLSMVDCRNVVLMIYDVNGKEVATVLEKRLPAGEHMVQFDASGLPAGVYFYELSAKGKELRIGGKLVIQR
jgi:hypothetical protein